MKVLESEFFNLSKKNPTDLMANSGILLRVRSIQYVSCQYNLILTQELRKLGILYDDPRLQPLIYALGEIKEKDDTVFSINNINLEFGEFCK